MTHHGALLEVQGVGVLLLGPSGIGKSECALELLRRGHRLVGDDVVGLRREAERVIGSAPPRVRHYMEIRGLGILFAPDLFGADAVRDEFQVDLVCRLEPWREGADYDRVGLERAQVELAGLSLPYVVLPARPAGSMATLVEVCARDHRLRVAGVNAPRQLDTRLRREMDRP